MRTVPISPKQKELLRGLIAKCEMTTEKLELTLKRTATKAQRLSTITVPLQMRRGRTGSGNL